MQSAARVEIRLFDAVTASVAGADVDLGPPLQRALLAALVVDIGHPLSTAALVDRLWPEDRPATADKSIQKYVWRLRTELGPPTIVRTSRGYRLDVDAGRIDTVRFEREMSAARAEPEPATRLARISQVLEHFPGEPLADVTQPFAAIERSRLEEVRLAAQEDRLYTGLAVGRPEFVIPTASDLVNRYPLRERLWRALILGLYQVGRQSEALQVYQRLREHLADELGLQPSAELQQLELQVLHQDPVIGRSPEPTARPRRRSRTGIEESRYVTVIAVAERAGAPLDPTGDPGLAVGRHGGRTVSLAGMAVGLFGLPANGDDPVRAARAALELAGGAGTGCAVVSGEAVVVDQDPLVELQGGLLDRLRRQVELAAAATAVVIDESTLRALGPVAEHRRVGRSLVLDRLREADEETDTGPLVGRERELDQIRSAWERCEADRARHQLTIVGEGGIGKSRLLRRARVDLADRCPTWHQETCLQVGDGGFGPIARLLRAIFGPEPLDELDRRIRVDRSSWEVAWLRNHASALLAGASTELADHVESVRAWARLVRLGIGPRPAVIVFEDIHWAGPELGQFLDEVLLDAGEPLLILRTTRPEQPSSRTSAGPHWQSSSMALPPLDPRSAEALAEALLGPAANDELILQIAERSGGSPLFVHELVRANDGSGALAPPETIRSALSARIDRAGAAARLVLQALAVIGGPATAGTVATVLDEEEAVVHAAFADLRRRRLLQPARSDPRLHDIAHPLVAEAAAAMVPVERRLLIHRRLAVRLQAGPEQALDTLEAISFHLGRAHELSVELVRPDADELAVASGMALLDLGRRLVSFDATRSLEMLLLARGRLEPCAPDWARATLEAGRAAADLARWDEAEDLLAAVIAAFTTMDDRRGEATARIALDGVRRARGDGRAGAGTERAIELVRDQPGPELASALSRHVAQIAVAGASREALDLAGWAGPVVEQHGAAEDGVRLQHALALARLDLGQPSGLSDLRRTLADCLDHGLTRQAAAVYNNLGNNTWFRVGPGDAIPILDNAIALATDRGHTFIADFTASTLTEVLFDAGRWDRVLTVATELIARDDASGGSQAGDSAAYGAGLVHLWRGRLDQAGRMLSVERLGRFRAIGDAQHVSPWLVAAALRTLADGDAPAALALIEEMGEATAEDDRWRCLGLHDAARIAVAAGDGELALRLVPTSPQPVWRHELSRLTALAVVTEAAGDLAAATGFARAAREGWHDFGHRLEAALAALAEARLLTAQGAGADDDDQIDAARLRRAASRTLRELGVARRSIPWVG